MMARATDSFVDQTRQYVAAQGLLRAGAAVLVGVSGGADSVGLAAVLRELGDWELHLCHVHHGLRSSADADAEFVAALACQWELPCHQQRIDAAGLAQQWGLGVEEAARRARYDVFQRLAGQVGAAAVAVAHHADDQAETVLHHIVRGTHLRGLSGMSPRRKLSGQVELIRPLLWARRSQIEDYCRRHGLSWRVDESNLQSDYTRNFIRNELLPLLRERMNTKVDEALLRLASAAQEAERTLEKLAEQLLERAIRKQSPQALSLRLAPLQKAQPLLARMALRLGLERLGAPQRELGQERFAELAEVVAGRLPAVELPGGVRVRHDGRFLSMDIVSLDRDV